MLFQTQTRKNTEMKELGLKPDGISAVRTREGNPSLLETLTALGVKSCLQRGHGQSPVLCVQNEESPRLRG